MTTPPEIDTVDPAPPGGLKPEKDTFRPGKDFWILGRRFFGNAQGLSGNR